MQEKDGGGVIGHDSSRASPQIMTAPAHMSSAKHALGDAHTDTHRNVQG